MSADPTCERTDLPKSMCSHCRGLDGPAVYAVTYTMPAQFGGTLICGHRVDIGDTIGLAGDDGWVCGKCIEDQP